MIGHVVTFTFTEQAPVGHASTVWAALKALPQTVPSLKRIEGGPDAGIVDSGNAQLAIVAYFDDAAGWHAYQEHPDHQRVAKELIRPLLASRSAVQFEV